MGANVKRLAVYLVGKAKNLEGMILAGSGTVNRDGSLNLYLEALPVDGRLVVKEIPAYYPPSAPPQEVRCFVAGCSHLAAQHKDQQWKCEAGGCACIGFEGVPF